MVNLIYSWNQFPDVKILIFLWEILQTGRDVLEPGVTILATTTTLDAMDKSIVYLSNLPVIMLLTNGTTHQRGGILAFKIQALTLV